jgi:hypothetical protein
MQPQAERPDLRYVMANLMSVCRRHALAAHGRKSRRGVVDIGDRLGGVGLKAQRQA